jgi:hypothetical protein
LVYGSASISRVLVSVGVGYFLHKRVFPSQAGISFTGGYSGFLRPLQTSTLLFLFLFHLQSCFFFALSRVSALFVSNARFLFTIPVFEPPLFFLHGLRSASPPKSGIASQFALACCLLALSTVCGPICSRALCLPTIFKVCSDSPPFSNT